MFKVGDKIVWHTTHGGYAESYSSPEVIVRETKSCFVTDAGSYIKKDTYDKRGFDDAWGSCTAILCNEEFLSDLQKRKELRKLQSSVNEKLSKLNLKGLSLEQLKALDTLLSTFFEG